MSTPESPSGGTRRLFHEDPYVRQFEARVLECIPADGGCDVVLDRTAFYATSGGQPHDLGLLGGSPVRDVADHDGVLRHRLAGPVAGDVTGEIDWQRRFDHMQQHTGQHILSQAFIQTAGAETVSFHLGVERVTIDLSRSDLTDAQVARAESLANDILAENREVRLHWTTRDGLDRFPLRKPPQVDGPIRIVEVRDFDFSACGGTHVARTGEIGLIKILRREKYKGGVRVEFLCGSRALRDYAGKHELLRGIAERASIQDREVADLVERLQSELLAARKRLREFEEAGLDREANRLAAGALAVPGYRLVQVVTDIESPELLKFLALKLRAEPEMVALLGAQGSDGRGHLVMARSDGLDLDMAAALKAALPVIDGRGGGRPEMAQGSGPAASKLTEALEAAAGTLGDRTAGLA